MEKDIKNKLIESGYTDRQADITAGKLLKVDDILKPAVKEWGTKGLETDVESHGYTTSGLMRRFPGMTYPAALLTIDWLLSDPELARRIIEKGVR